MAGRTSRSRARARPRPAGPARLQPAGLRGAVAAATPCTSNTQRRQRAAAARPTKPAGAVTSTRSAIENRASSCPRVEITAGGAGQAMRRPGHPSARRAPGAAHGGRPQCSPRGIVGQREEAMRAAGRDQQGVACPPRAVSMATWRRKVALRAAAGPARHPGFFRARSAPACARRRARPAKCMPRSVWRSNISPTRLGLDGTKSTPAAAKVFAAIEPQEGAALVARLRVRISSTPSIAVGDRITLRAPPSPAPRCGCGPRSRRRAAGARDLGRDVPGRIRISSRPIAMQRLRRHHRDAAAGQQPALLGGLRSANARMSASVTPRALRKVLPFAAAP